MDPPREGPWTSVSVVRFFRKAASHRRLVLLYPPVILTASHILLSKAVQAKSCQFTRQWRDLLPQSEVGFCRKAAHRKRLVLHYPSGASGGSWTLLQGREGRKFASRPVQRHSLGPLYLLPASGASLTLRESRRAQKSVNRPGKKTMYPKGGTLQLGPTSDFHEKYPSGTALIRSIRLQRRRPPQPLARAVASKNLPVAPAKKATDLPREGPCIFAGAPACSLTTEVISFPSGPSARGWASAVLLEWTG